MGQPVRNYDPQTMYFLTSRTDDSRFFMAPSDMTNELIGGSLARAVRKAGVELFAYVFTSNHLHAMVRAPSEIAMSYFMQRLQSDIAIKVGRLIRRRRGKFFGRRYSAEPIVDEGAEVERLVYILKHGVKEGLVPEVRQWPGLSSVQALLAGGAATAHRWRNWTRLCRMNVRKKNKIDRFSEDCPTEPERLELSPLPCWAGLTGAERAGIVAKLVAEIDAEAPNKTGGRTSQIKNQSPRGRPRRTKQTQRPQAHASTTAKWVEAVIRYRVFVAAFRKASRRWLAGFFDVEFPPHCFRPPPWRALTQ